MEAWLQRWLEDGLPGEEDLQAEAMHLEARCLVPLRALAAERPEVCPLLSSMLSRFEDAISGWLLQWPQAEPPRSGLPMHWGKQTAEEMELELHGVLALLGGFTGARREEPLLPGHEEAVEHFRQMALGWIFKFDSLYGLQVLTQHERLLQSSVTANAQRVSMLWWELDEVSVLLRCPFFRPSELDLWRFARRWCIEGAGSAALATSQAGQEAGDEHDVDAAISEALLWELLPAKEQLVQEAGDRSLPPQAAVTTEPAPVDAFLGCQAGLAAASIRPLQAQQVPGSSFQRLFRRADCAFRQFDDPAGFHMQRQETSSSLRCWNMAVETEVVGACRQTLASDVPMSRGSSFRLDLRLNSGSTSDTAHLLEVGIMANPEAGVCFDAGTPGVCRPLLQGEEEGKSEPFFRFVTVLDILLEGVRLSVEIDLDEASVSVRNLPEVEAEVETMPRGASLAAWLEARNRALAMGDRNPGELDCPLFKEHVEHLSDLIDKGSLEGELADTVLADKGVKWVMASNIVPDVPEAYHFYITVPAGLELEIF
eukprot:TRINITY_DN8649_c0_g1_i1.p1 TRINITY_DN8649_c0_g1~~TRINITY_DN8649_c0_g1_i1.p1  ORF type:complete len:620 (-),score=161.91 TRINITY_DN8649_c0_g1_i1:50-1669(-)